METELKITYENEYVQVISNGAKNYEHAYKVWSSAIKVCKEKKCFKILGIADSSNSVSIMEAYDHKNLFSELNISYKYRIAWVELNPNAVNTAQFIETVLMNRGFPGRVFPSIEEAKKWLLEEPI